MSYCLNPNCQKPQWNSTLTKFCLSCGSRLLLRERYRAIQLIGQGGFGRTFLSVDEDKPSKPRCVIKQFFPQSLGTNHTEKAVELFHQEAVRLDELGKHPQIPDLLAHFDQDEQQYLIQEFIDGQNLADELENNGVFNETQIRELLNDLLPVLAFVHQRQVIHRDIKPENIIRRSSDARLVLVDFGAAKFATGTALFKTGTIIGSVEYTASEQLRGKAVFASDLYSLGATCIYLLTRVSPFDLFDTNEGIWVWRNYLRSPISDSLSRILDKMLEQYTKQRYQSALEVLQALNSPKITTTITNPQLASPPSSTYKPSPPPIFVPLESERGIDYTRLRDLLSAKNWKDADGETKNKILEVMGLQQQGYLFWQNIKDFPCTDLRTIDQLWVRHSRGRFGFSVQKRLWIEEGGKRGVYNAMVFQTFADKVGWKSYFKMSFDLDAPIGHLPLIGVGGASGLVGLWAGMPMVYISLFSRLDTCRI